MKKIFSRTFLIISAVLILAPAGFSTTVRVKDIVSLVKESDSVGLFKVISVRNIALNGKHLFTRYYLRALICFYGCTDGESKVIDVPGGSSGKIKARVIGAPELVHNENYIMILSKNPKGPNLSIAGFNQGVFVKVFDSVNQKWVLNPLVLKTVKFKGKKVNRIGYKEFIDTVKSIISKIK